MIPVKVIWQWYNNLTEKLRPPHGDASFAVYDDACNLIAYQDSGRKTNIHVETKLLALSKRLELLGRLLR